MEDEYDEFLEDEPDFIELNNATKKATKQVQLDNEPSKVIKPDDDEYQFINQGVNPVFKVKPSKAINLADPYDMWTDLAQAKANISFGQLIQLAPLLRKKMREGATTHKARKVGQLNHLEDVRDVELHWSGDHTMVDTYESVEIDVEIVDKHIPHAVIDDGVNINIMPKSTMKKLGLAITHSSQYNIRIANQALITPMGRIKDLKMTTGGIDYQLNSEILLMKGSLSMVQNNEAYPLLLGQGFLRQCGGVVD